MHKQPVLILDNRNSVLIVDNRKSAIKMDDGQNTANDDPLFGCPDGHIAWTPLLPNVSSASLPVEQSSYGTFESMPGIEKEEIPDETPLHHSYCAPLPPPSIKLEPNQSAEAAVEVVNEVTLASGITVHLKTNKPTEPPSVHELTLSTGATMDMWSKCAKLASGTSQKTKEVEGLKLSNGADVDLRANCRKISRIALHRAEHLDFWRGPPLWTNDQRLQNYDSSWPLPAKNALIKGITAYTTSKRSHTSDPQKTPGKDRWEMPKVFRPAVLRPNLRISETKLEQLIKIQAARYENMHCRFQCVLCDDWADSYPDLFRHWQSHPVGTEPPRKVVPCPPQIYPSPAPKREVEPTTPKVALLAALAVDGGANSQGRMVVSRVCDDAFTVAGNSLTFRLRYIDPSLAKHATRAVGRVSWVKAPKEQPLPVVVVDKTKACPYCPSRVKHVQAHIQTQHPTSTGEQCEICGAYFKNQRALADHSLRIHDQLILPVSCCYCPKNFVLRDELREHQRTHKMLCELCGMFVTGNVGEVREHIKVAHSDVRNYVCDDCGADFKTKESLMVHMRVHRTKMPFKCTYCDRRFRQTTQRKLHEVKIHTKRYKHSCPHCPQKFLFHCHLARHLATHGFRK